MKASNLPFLQIKTGKQGMLWKIRTSLIRKCDLNIQDQGHVEIMHISVVIL